MKSFRQHFWQQILFFLFLEETLMIEALLYFNQFEIQNTIHNYDNILYRALEDTHSYIHTCKVNVYIIRLAPGYLLCVVDVHIILLIYTY